MRSRIKRLEQMLPATDDGVELVVGFVRREGDPTFTKEQIRSMQKQRGPIKITFKREEVESNG